MNAQYKYIVIKRESCPECHGCGFIEDTDWREFWQWFKRYRRHYGQDPNEEVEDFWWQQQGFEDNDRPPEEWPCEECDGTGIEESEVSLQEALEALGIMSVLKLCGFVQENS